MTVIDNVLLFILLMWCSLGIFLSVCLCRCLNKQYRRFYPHPVVGLILDNTTDTRMSIIDKIWTVCSTVVITFPISIPWFLVWCLYKLGPLLVNALSYDQEILATKPDIEELIKDDLNIVPKSDVNKNTQSVLTEEVASSEGTPVPTECKKEEQELETTIPEEVKEESQDSPQEQDC